MFGLFHVPSAQKDNVFCHVVSPFQVVVTQGVRLAHLKNFHNQIGCGFGERKKAGEVGSQMTPASLSFARRFSATSDLRSLPLADKIPPDHVEPLGII
jgi:hypothetical protein